MSNLVQALQGFREGSTYYTTGDGFYFCLNRTKGTRKFLKCFRHGRYKCMARASFDVYNREMSVTVNHNHAPEPWVEELLKERHAVKGLGSSRGLDHFQSCQYERFPGIEKAMPYESLKLQMEKRRQLSELNEKNQNTEMKQLHFLNLCDIEDMTKRIRAREAQVQRDQGQEPPASESKEQDPLSLDASEVSMVMMESHVERFLEQRLEQFPDHVSENHFDQNSELNNAHPRCEVTMNNQGGDKLHFNGYSYSKKAISANAIRWTCATPTRSDTRCKGAITTDRERPYHNPRSLVEHNHPPEDSEASIMRDIARAKRRFWRKTFPHPFQIYPWMLPLQQMQEQSGSRDDPSSLEATFGMGGAAGMMDHSEAGPSSYMDDDVRVKMEPEWVDAGALEPNCELEGQFDDNQDFDASYSDAMAGGDNQNFPMYGQQQSQQLPLIQDSQDPVKLHVPGKPNLTITVAPNRQGPSQSNISMSTPPPLHLLNPILNRKRGRPRGSAYGSYSESDDRVTTILTDSIIASQKLEKMGVSAATAYRSPPVNTASMPPSLVKPRSRDPEAVRAAEIVNGAQNRSGPRVTEELEKVHLKLKQEVLALEVQNLKAEREKLKAYRRNVAIRKEIMALHLQLGKGFPTECASSGRGFETSDHFVHFMDTESDNDFSPPPSKEPLSIPKKLPNVSITKQQPSQSPKISIRKSLQTSSQSPNVSPLSTSSATKAVTPSSANKAPVESRGQGGSSQSSSNKSSQGSDHRQPSTRRRSGDTRSPSNNTEDPSANKQSADNHKPSNKPSSDQENNQESKGGGDSCSQSSDPVKDELVPLDSVSSELSMEMLSEPGSSQWTTQSSAPMTEHDGFDDIQFEGDDSYDNTGSLGEFSGEPIGKEPPDGQYSSFAEDSSAQKRRRVENMWEPDEPL